jgi:hypothetical protein
VASLLLASWWASSWRFSYSTEWVLVSITTTGATSRARRAGIAAGFTVSTPIITGIVSAVAVITAVTVTSGCDLLSVIRSVVLCQLHGYLFSIKCLCCLCRLILIGAVQQVTDHP